MLIWGRTFLQPYLTGWRFGFYWTVCAIFAGAAVSLSMIDILMIRRQLRRQHEELIRKTFERIRGTKPDSSKTETTTD